MTAVQPNEFVAQTQRRGTAAALLRDAVLLIDGSDDELVVRYGTLSEEGLARAAFCSAPHQSAEVDPAPPSATTSLKLSS